MSNLKPVNFSGFDDDFDAVEEAEIVQLVGLKLGEEEYAIDVLKIQEIIRTVEITSVPRTDSFVLGVMNLRGKVIPVVDLRVRFSLDKMDFDKETRIIVVRFETEHIGFVVDEVTEVIRIGKTMVEPTPPLVGSIGQEYILGICKYEDRLIILLDIDTVISDGKTITESDLRRKFLGQPASDAKQAIAYEDIAEAIEKEDEEDVEAVALEELEPSVEQETEDDADDLDSIDDLIAQELAKREKETEEFNKQKQAEEHYNSTVDVDVEDILNDALSQSDSAINGDEGHVVQDELDALIAMELAKREKETEEFNRLRKEQEKKNEKLEPEEVDLSAFLAKNEESGLDVHSFFQEDAPSTVYEEPLSNKEEPSATDELTNIKEEVDEPIFEEGSQDEKPEAELNIEQPETVFAPEKTTGQFIETDSLEELKNLSQKIINGDAVDLGIDIRGEIGELLKLILDTKGKVDEIDPTLLLSKESMPVVVKSLELVNEETEEATINLMEAADKMTAFYSSFIDDMSNLENLAYRKDAAGLLKNIEKVEEKIEQAENLGFGILHALEFQDITEQRLVKVVKSVEEVGARIGAILGIIKAKKDETGEAIKGASQDDIDTLLAEFGLN